MEASTTYGPKIKNVNAGLEWNGEVVEDRSVQLLRWRAPDDARAVSDASLRLSETPDERATEAVFQLRINPRHGSLLDVLLNLLHVLPRVTTSSAYRRLRSGPEEV